MSAIVPPREQDVAVILHNSTFPQQSRSSEPAGVEVLLQNIQQCRWLNGNQPAEDLESMWLSVNEHHSDYHDKPLNSV